MQSRDGSERSRHGSRWRRLDLTARPERPRDQRPCWLGLAQGRGPQTEQAKGYGDNNDECRSLFADRSALSSVRRVTNSLCRQQSGLVGSDRIDVEPVAGEPLGVPTDLGPSVGRRARGRDRPAWLWPLRRSPRADRTGRDGHLPRAPHRGMGPGRRRTWSVPTWAPPPRCSWRPRFQTVSRA